MIRRWGSGRLTYLSAAALLLWTALMIVLIAREPSPGASSPSALATALSQAVSTNDTDAAARLLAGNPEAAGLLLGVARCGDAFSATQSHLQIFHLGTVCASLPIAEHDGRWFIDPEAASN